jgi:osmotically-inducible protein OsmY
MINTLDKTDTELQDDILSELSYDPSVNLTDIVVFVENGTVTLNGCATSYIEKWAAVNAVKRIKAVKMAIEQDINSALKRSAIVDVDRIQVESENNKVVLRGDVRSFAARDEAERIAWSEPGVCSVDNHLGVNWSSILQGRGYANVE